MGFLDDMLKKGSAALRQMNGDRVFLRGIAAAAANVTAADGQIDDEEIDSALAGMKANQIVAHSYGNAQIEDALRLALDNAKTRLGKMDNQRSIDALGRYDLADRQNVLLVAADVADNGGIAEVEFKVLQDIAKRLSLDCASLGIAATAA